jgi:hypothetical protein
MRRPKRFAALPCADGGRRGGWWRPAWCASSSSPSIRCGSFYVNVDMPAGAPIERTLAECRAPSKVVRRHSMADGRARNLALGLCQRGVKFTDTEPLYGDPYGQVHRLAAIRARQGGRDSRRDRRGMRAGDRGARRRSEALLHGDEGRAADGEADLGEDEVRRLPAAARRGRCAPRRGGKAARGARSHRRRCARARRDAPRARSREAGACRGAAGRGGALAAFVRRGRDRCHDARRRREGGGGGARPPGEPG